MPLTHDKAEWKALLSAAQAALRSGDYGAAIKTYETALKSVESKFGKDSSHCAVILSELGECYETQGREDLADECYRKVREILQAQNS